ncbi:hypothetical protein BHM03_00052199 [Ensete ventricosum]|nr:hypothetical protein BHM03_00052199 [Ensete ventricosum]
MAINFDDDISLVEKEQTILLERSSKIRLNRTIMPPRDQAPVKDVDLEQRLMNMKEGDCYVVNHDKGLTTANFGGGDAATAGAIDRSEGQREKRCGRRFAIQGKRKRNERADGVQQKKRKQTHQKSPALTSTRDATAGSLYDLSNYHACT